MITKSLALWINLWLFTTPCMGFIPIPSFTRAVLSLRSASEKNAPIGKSRIYFDIEVTDSPLGRLVFELADPSPLPLHTENLIELCKGSRRGIDPLAHYVGCEFDYSPVSIEDGSGRYRWGHVLRGRGRNAVGRPGEMLVDHEHMLACTHSCYGGQYYGVKYEGTSDDYDDDKQSVALALSLAGPGRGSSRFSIVRVGESPPEWRERLLLNCGVVGFLAPESMNTLRWMAQQKLGPPKVVAAGVL